MNDFTKEELEYILRSLAFYLHLEDELIINPIIEKIQSMIDNNNQDPWNKKEIAKSHLSEAESLISHAMCLLGMKNE